MAASDAWIKPEWFDGQSWSIYGTSSSRGILHDVKNIPKRNVVQYLRMYAAKLGMRISVRTKNSMNTDSYTIELRACPSPLPVMTGASSASHHASAVPQTATGRLSID